MAGSLWPAPERITRKPMRGSSHAICHCVGLRTQHAKGCRRAVSRWRLSNEQTSPFAPAPKEGSLQPFGMHVCYRNVEITYLFSRPGVTEPKGAEARGSRTMLMEPQECRQNGLRCRELAERATDSHLKDVLEELAKRWVTRATELERAQALRDANEPTAKTR